MTNGMYLRLVLVDILFRFACLRLLRSMLALDDAAFVIINNQKGPAMESPTLRVLSTAPAHYTGRWKPAYVGLLRSWTVTLAATATRSQSEHLVLEYEDRLAVHNGDALSWSDLAAIRDALWGPGVAAIEAFPPTEEVINLRPTRHLWRSDTITSAVTEVSKKLHEDHKSVTR